jgi:hypothetical protein
MAEDAVVVNRSSALATASSVRFDDDSSVTVFAGLSGELPNPGAAAPARIIGTGEVGAAAACVFRERGDQSYDADGEDEDTEPEEWRIVSQADADDEGHESHDREKGADGDREGEAGRFGGP